MKRYIKEWVILILQLGMFYIFPLFAGPTDAMGMVLIILLSAIVLAFVLGIISDSKLKCLYPFVIALLFIPSVFIYYNETAFIHSIWYLVVSSVGLLFGSVIHVLIKKFKV